MNRPTRQCVTLYRMVLRVITLYTFSSIMRASVPFQNSLQDRFLNGPRIKKKKNDRKKMFYVQYAITVFCHDNEPHRNNMTTSSDCPAVLHSFQTVPNFIDNSRLYSNA